MNNQNNKEVQILLSELKKKANDQKRFLVIGKIQSGKTKFFTQLIFQAIREANFDFVILLSGVTKALNKQTIGRLKEHIKENRELDDIKIEDWGETYKGLRSDRVREINWKNLVSSVIKNASKLRQIKKMVKSFARHRVLIVDDEADQASLNTQATREEESASAVNDELTQIMKALTNQNISFNYMGLTATPAGILFLERDDLLAPDFSLLLKPREGYMGLKEFYLPENYSRRFIVASESDANDWKYLHEVINTFIVGTVLSKMNCSKMLIHIDRKTSTHEQIHEEVDKHLKKMSYYSQKQNPYMAGGGWLEEQVKKGLKYYQIAWQSWTPKESSKLLEIIKKTGAKVVNSKTSEKTETPQHCIYIGGDVFKRGYSFDNLLVTFLTRRAKGVSYWDATAQNCRFLGYRLPYFEWMKIFVSNEVEKDVNYPYL